MNNIQNNGNQAVHNMQINIRKDVLEILKAVTLLETNHGLNFIINHVRGVETPWTKPEHAELETFGVLEAIDHDRVRNTISLLLDRQLLEPGNKYASVITISEAGKAFLDAPEDLMINSKMLWTRKFDKALTTKLRVLRKELAEQTGEQPYRVYSELTLERIVRKRPFDLNSLLKIPGMDVFKADQFGHSILQVVESVEELRRIYAEKMLFQMVTTPTYQDAKEKFEAGMTVDEIAEAKGITGQTVMNYLMKLHQATEIDLRPWIENHVDEKTLFKGGEYFKRVKDQRMKVAFDTLGIEYDTLKLCKLYVSDVAVNYEVVSV